MCTNNLSSKIKWDSEKNKYEYHCLGCGKIYYSEILYQSGWICPNCQNNGMKIEFVCDKCGKTYQLKFSSYKDRVIKNTPNYCYDCMREYVGKKSSETKINKSPEEKAEYSKKLSEAALKRYEDPNEHIKTSEACKLGLQNMSNEDKQRMIENHSIAQKNRFKSKKSRKLHSIKIKQGIKNMSKDDYDRMCENQSKGQQKRRATMSVEEKQALDDLIRNGIHNMSEEAKEQHRQNVGKAKREEWDNKSDDDIQAFSMSIKQGLANMTPEAKLQHSENQSRAQSERYANLSSEDKFKQIESLLNYKNNLSDDDLINYERKRLSNSAEHNKFHQKFEKYFDAYLSESYYYKNEFVSINDKSLHSWDYGIYSKLDDTLVAAVDLDGAFFHGDNCDYDGLHSKEEYDINRLLSINNNIKIFIIYEEIFEKSFDYLCTHINLSYDEFINSKLLEYSKMKFPYPSYTDKELYNSYNQLISLDCDSKYYKDLSVNTRIGDRLIYHFHPSIFNINLGNNPSHYMPIEIWEDKKLLRKCIENKELYHNYLNPNKILQGLHISNIAPIINILSASRSKIIINKYLNEFDTIFDPFCGFGGSMLGALSLDKHFIGNDINNTYIDENIELLKFLKLENMCKFYNKDVINFKGEFESLFTCVPYLNEQCWKSSESWVFTCDKWIDLCLNNFKCKKYLFIVDSTEKYKNNIVGIIKKRFSFQGKDDYIILL